MPAIHNRVSGEEYYKSTFRLICDRCRAAKEVPQYVKNNKEYSRNYGEWETSVYYKFFDFNDIAGESLVEHGYYYMYVKIRISEGIKTECKYLLCKKCLKELKIDQEETRLDAVKGIMALLKINTYE